MTVQSFLDTATKQLEAAGIGTARLDCLVLIEDVTGINRAQLLARPETKLTQKDVRQLQNLINQRAAHLPLAYVRGKTEFYGREFLITRDVLEPRPESETMIELFKELPAENPLQVVDVGTGSGALGITAALERPSANVTLIDIDKRALAVAEQNCDRFELDISCAVDDLLSHAAKRGITIDVVLANLPYVPDDFTINAAALHEPKIAIFGGPDGLDLYRRLFEQCRTLRPHYILTESLPMQHEVLATIAKQCGYVQSKEADFIQLFSLAEPWADLVQASSAVELPASL